jgi:hypothetical protein
MSAVEDLELESIMSPKAFKALKRKLRIRANELKTLRAFYDKQARRIFKKFYVNNNRRWKTPGSRIEFRKLMTKRHKLHERIARIVPEAVEPEWDSP